MYTMISMVEAQTWGATTPYNDTTKVITVTVIDICNIDCLKALTAFLVGFISTVNGHHKKKRSLERLALVAGT